MIVLSRRAFTFGLSAASASVASSLFSETAFAQATSTKRRHADLAKALSPTAQFRIGRFTVVALADGYADMPFSYFPGRTPEQIEEMAKETMAAKPAGIRFLFNQYLVDDGERLILIDAGPAGTLGKTGRLLSSLESIGVRPDSIDAVIITHLHQDHMGDWWSEEDRTFRRPRSTLTGEMSSTGPTRPSALPLRIT